MDTLNSIFMKCLVEQRQEVENKIVALNKKIERIEKKGLFCWRKLFSPYLKYLKRRRKDLERWHFRYSVSESIGKGKGETKADPELAAKVLFGVFKD